MGITQELLDKVQQEHTCTHYLETGLHRGGSMKLALASIPHFRECHSIEIRKDFVALCRKQFEDEPRCHIHNGDSSYLGQYLAAHPVLCQGKVLFFLDSHLDDSKILERAVVIPKRRCPIIDELRAIARTTCKDNVILVDDVRLLRSKYPWHEGSYGDINFLETIQQIVLSINPNYTFEFIDSTFPGDILLCHT